MSEANSHHQIRKTPWTVDTKENTPDKSRDPRGSKVTKANSLFTHHYNGNKSHENKNQLSPEESIKIQKISPKSSHQDTTKQPHQHAKQPQIETMK
jgi:hypothetical protein